MLDDIKLFQTDKTLKHNESTLMYANFKKSVKRFGDPRKECDTKTELDYKCMKEPHWEGQKEKILT